MRHQRYPIDQESRFLTDPIGSVQQRPFYVFPSCAAFIGRTTAGGRHITDDEAFCMALLEEGGVAAVQGAAFGQSPFFRLSYAASEADLTAAMDRIEGFCAGFK
jgi:aspartate aminotransferase